MKIAGLPRQRTTQPTFKITIRENLRSTKDQLLEATASHTFIRCAGDTLVKARNLKGGDCLMTATGRKLVAEVEPIPEDEAIQSETYSVITDGGANDIISVGGVLAHATDLNRRWSFSGRSTVAVRVSPSSSKTETKLLADLKVGDEILKEGFNPQSAAFAKVAVLLHTPAPKRTYEIKMASKHVHLRNEEMQHRVQATSDQTFIRCSRNEEEKGKEELVKTKDLEVGDCLNTFHGDKLVDAVLKVSEKEATNYETYTIVTEGGAKELVRARGGLCMRAWWALIVEWPDYPNCVSFTKNKKYRSWWEVSWRTPLTLPRSACRCSQQAWDRSTLNYLL